MLKALLGKPAVHEDTWAEIIGSLGEMATLTARCEGSSGCVLTLERTALNSQQLAYLSLQTNS